MIPERFLNRDALPVHLKDKLHNDWPWPMSYLPRAINAYGPRCDRSSRGYKAWPPKLVRGKGVSRWESNKAQSIIEIPELNNREVAYSDVYGKQWAAIERNPGNPNYNQEGVVELNWVEQSWWEIESNLIVYSPSAIQLFSPEGWMEMEPWYKTWHKGAKGKSPNWRLGFRPDHCDLYYNWGPFAGLNFE